jgi:ubiquinone/menaquinone biosynthesis C-methylase UbiE
MNPETFKQNIANVFETVAEGYDHPAARYFAFAADRLVSHLKPKPGSKLLDVAAGTGMVSIAAGQAVGPGPLFRDLFCRGRVL